MDDQPQAAAKYVPQVEEEVEVLEGGQQVVQTEVDGSATNQPLDNDEEEQDKEEEEEDKEDELGEGDEDWKHMDEAIKVGKIKIRVQAGNGCVPSR